MTFHLDIAGSSHQTGGNTHNPSLPSKSKQVQRFSFTLNNWTEEELKELTSIAIATKSKYIFGKEIGESGTPHLQCYIVFPQKKTWSGAMSILNNKRIHLEESKKSEKANIIYCSKDNDYITNFNFEKEIPIKCDLKYENLYDWQKSIEDLFHTEPDGRTVNWYYDTIGGKGKSSFCRYMVLKYTFDKCLVIQGGKLADIMNIIFNTKLNNFKMMIIDIPRNNKNNVSYSAIECILNGMITNTKFETGVKIFNPPHVVIFSNMYPDTSNLSLDRWKITNIRKDEQPTNDLDV